MGWHFDLSNFRVPGQFSSKIYLDAINKIVKAGKKFGNPWYNGIDKTRDGFLPI